MALLSLRKRDKKGKEGGGIEEIGRAYAKEAVTFTSFAMLNLTASARRGSVRVAVYEPVSVAADKIE